MSSNECEFSSFTCNYCAFDTDDVAIMASHCHSQMHKLRVKQAKVMMQIQDEDDDDDQSKCGDDAVVVINMQ